MSNKLRIGFFTDTYRPQINGVVASIDSFRLQLEKKGHQVDVFCPKLGVSKNERNISRFRSFKFVFQPEYHISIPFSRHILKDFWAKELDIVHAHTPFSMGLLGYYYAYIRKVPFVYTYHTLYPEYLKSYVFKGRVITPRMVEKAAALFSNRCDLNIAPSEKIKRLLKSYGVSQPIKVLPTGIKLNEFKKQSKNTFRKKYKLKKEDKVLIFVGRLGKEKNVDFLIKSLELINKQNTDVKLVIIGDGPHKKNLQLLAKKRGLRTQVVFTGYFKKPEVVQAYQASDLFVFASKTDTQGMVILEAAACGLPIVAVKDTAFTNIVKDKINGYTTGESKMTFSKKVLQLVSDEKTYKKMALKSEEIAKDYSIAKQTDKLIDIYKGI
ncbi:glycosyltransferase family 4 protein [Patescibacteria group bacterium]